MKSDEITYPAAFVYEENEGEVRSMNFQVLQGKDKQIAEEDIEQLKQRLEREKIPVKNITYLLKNQLAKLNLIPQNFIRPFNPDERDELKSS